MQTLAAKIANVPVYDPEWCMFSETVYPDETGLSAPIYAHTQTEFISKDPVIGVKVSPNWEDNSWTVVTITDQPIDIYNKLSPEAFDKVVQYILLNKERLIKFWNCESTTTARNYLEKIT